MFLTKNCEAILNIVANNFLNLCIKQTIRDNVECLTLISSYEFGIYSRLCKIKLFLHIFTHKMKYSNLCFSINRAT